MVKLLEIMLAETAVRVLYVIFYQPLELQLQVWEKFLELMFITLEVVVAIPQVQTFKQLHTCLKEVLAEVEMVVIIMGILQLNPVLLIQVEVEVQHTALPLKGLQVLVDLVLSYLNTPILTRFK
jgi:hypothetical protein